MSPTPIDRAELKRLCAEATPNRRQSRCDWKKLRSAVDYDLATGHLTWLSRRLSRNASWNSQCAGRRAGSLRSDGYRQVRFDNVMHFEHRLIWFWMTGEWPPEEIDHINGDKADNRWANLREATRGQNEANQATRKCNTSGFSGVSYAPRRGNFYARLMVDGQRIHLGTFPTAEEASAAYVAAQREHRGEFCRVPSAPPAIKGKE